MDPNYILLTESKSLNNKFILRFLCSRISVIFFLIIILCYSIIPVSTTLKKEKLYIKLLFIIPGVIASLILLIFSKNKLEIIKDKLNNKIIIKVINFLCFPNKIIKIDSENFHFYLRIIENKDSEGNYYGKTIDFIIVNDYKNIDLDTSNIKKKPVKFFYTFKNVRNIRNAKEKYTSDLNNFFGISDNNSNPLFFNINNYIKKKANTRAYYSSEQISNYMKFSAHLFTYHFMLYSLIDHIMLIICVILNGTVIIIAYKLLYEVEKPFKYYGFYSFVILNIILYIVYHCLKMCFEKIFRIDCIFSRDFDRIFIGIVKYNKTSYVNTFEFQMNNIDRFILEEKSSKNYNLNVQFKNNEKQLICNIKKNQKELEGLTYLLNERLIKNNDNLNINIINEKI